MVTFEIAQNLHARGQFREAERAYRSILAADPDNVDGLFALAVLCHQTGNFREAIDCLTQAIRILPNEASLHHGLGTVQADFGLLDDAQSSYRVALELRPRSAVFHNDLAVCLAKLGRWQDARRHFEKAIALETGFPAALNGLGLANMVCADWAGAVSAFERALVAAPDLSDARANLGMAYVACDRHEDALEQFAAKLETERGGAASVPLAEKFRFVTKPKLTHDIDQFRYLAARSGDSRGQFAALAEIYADIEKQIDWASSDFKVRLTDDQYRRIQDTYNRPFHVVDASSVAGGALNPDLDTADITRRYFDTGPGVVHFDEMLKPEALSRLWRYLMESTIWFHIEHPEGYVGAYVDDGLACPLLLQIAADLRAAFPEIFAGHQLKQLWAYKYSSTLGGINLHADDAAVNVNFWISPSSANLDPRSGGLIVYPVEAPENWANSLYDTSRGSAEAIRAYLNEFGADSRITIPYGENRAAIFNSDLFHETDQFSFKPSYENRRINVTMLFGQRAT
jgi:Flp pilus assembly protein TadD